MILTSSYNSLIPFIETPTFHILNILSINIQCYYNFHITSSMKPVISTWFSVIWALCLYKAFSPVLGRLCSVGCLLQWGLGHGKTPSQPKLSFRHGISIKLSTNVDGHVWFQKIIFPCLVFYFDESRINSVKMLISLLSQVKSKHLEKKKLFLMFWFSECWLLNIIIISY